MDSETSSYQKLHVGYLCSYLPHKLEYLYQHNCLEAYLETVVQATQDRENWLIENKDLDKHAARFISLYQHITPDRTLLSEGNREYAIGQGCLIVPGQNSRQSLGLQKELSLLDFPDFDFRTASVKRQVTSKDIASRKALNVTRRQVWLWNKHLEGVTDHSPGSMPHQMQIFDRLQVGKVINAHILYCPFPFFGFGSTRWFSTTDLLFVQNVPIIIEDISFDGFTFHYKQSFKIKSYDRLIKHEKYQVFDKRKQEHIKHYQLTFPDKSDNHIIKIYHPPEPNWEQLSRAETFLYSDIDLF